MKFGFNFDLQLCALLYKKIKTIVHVFALVVLVKEYVKFDQHIFNIYGIYHRLL